MRSSILIACAALLIATVGDARSPWAIKNTYPHDHNAFTQGLVWHGRFLYESTGLYGQSSVRRVELITGDVKQRLDVKEQYFAEGLAYHQGRLVQLTWKSRTGFVYDASPFGADGLFRQTFEPIREFRYNTEGWGLAAAGGLLWLSDTAVHRHVCRHPHVDMPTGLR